MTDHQNFQNETLNVFVDTNIFENKLFDLKNWSLKKLKELSQEKKIKLYTTSIALREIEKRVIVSLNEVFVNTKKINTHLRNTGIPELSLEKIKSERIAIWREYIKASNAEILTPTEDSIEEVFDLYFASEPPFENNAKKKHEFPDAFIFLTLKAWCEENDETMYVISDDRLFRKACEKTPLIPLSKLEEFLDLYNKLEPFLYNPALSCFGELREEIEAGIKNNLESRWYDLIDLWDSEVTDFVINEVELHEPLVIDADKETCQIDVDVDVNASAQIHYDDPDFMFWDSETKETISLDRKSETVSGSFTTTVSLQIAYDLKTHHQICELESLAIPSRIHFRVESEGLSDRYEIVSSE